MTITQSPELNITKKQHPNPTKENPMADTTRTTSTAKATSTPVTADPTIPGVSSVSSVGKTVIDDGVISKVAGIATRSVPGVYAVGGGVSRALGAIRDAMNQTDRSQGISVEVGETQVAVDITLVAEYPMSLQKVADDVRAAVYEAIQDIVGMDVAEVNVTINDVHIPGEDDATTETVVETTVTPARVQ
jgi:uncharacterized alkaline shock family protein YloU